MRLFLRLPWNESKRVNSLPGRERERPPLHPCTLLIAIMLRERMTGLPPRHMEDPVLASARGYHHALAGAQRAACHAHAKPAARQWIIRHIEQRAQPKRACERVGHAHSIDAPPP